MFGKHTAKLSYNAALMSMNDESLLNIELSKRIDRKGDKRAILSNLVMIVDGKLVNSVQLLTPATFKFEIESKEEIENVEVMYSIYNQHGLLVLSSNSKFASEKQVSLKRGINIFSVSYNEFPLSCGVYKINVRIRDKYDKDIDWIENAFSFSIVESDIYGTGKFYKDSSSIMILPHKWII
jgi:hypothetical protein